MLWKKFAEEDAKGALAQLQSSQRGLSLVDAQERGRQNQRNQLPRETNHLFATFKRQLSSSFLILLLAASFFSFLIGDHLEGLLILLFLLINIALEMFQAYHSSKAIELLKRYLVEYVQVRRAGKAMTVESSQIVPGDIVLVKVGDRLPADVRWLDVRSLAIDESIMTGEAVAVEKDTAVMKVPPSGMYEAKNIGFAGTIVTAGSGEGVVFGTGRETALGDAVVLANNTKDRETVFEKGIRQFSRFILKLVVITLGTLFLANILIGTGEKNAVELIIFSLALAVTVVPEALPVILTVSLSRGSLKLAQKKVIVKRLSAIEDLGSIDILCMDKTGTITENLMRVSDVSAKDKEGCLEYAFAACLENPSRGRLHDSFDRALWQELTPAQRAHATRKARLDSIPFDPDRRRCSVLVSDGKREEIIVRGAPEEILRLSHGVDAFTKKSLKEWISAAGKRGERVLAVGRRSFEKGKKYSLYEEDHLEFLGLVAFSDPLKKTARHTLQRAKNLGITLKILTGDSKEVAQAVAEQVGLLEGKVGVYTGQELDQMSDAERRQAIFKGRVFARVSPRQKYEIIKVLQDRHEVGFLGEGINDAPALKLADVALVVEGASDIAREAADVVLLKKSLETIIDGVQEGRVIFANILKYLKIALTSNFGNFYSVAIASLFIPYLPMLPIQILLLNLLSDFPMISIATDRVDAEELEKPKNYKVPSIILLATILGIVSSIFDFIFLAAFYRGEPAVLQTTWFILSLITEVILIFSLRTRKLFFQAPPASWSLSLLSILVLFLAVFLPVWPSAQEIFQFISPHASIYSFIIVLCVAYFIATEAVKYLYYRHINAEDMLAPPKKKHA